MRTTTYRHWTAALLLPLWLAAAGCAHGTVEARRPWTTESKSSNDAWLGGQTHESTPVYENPDGSTTVGTQKTTNANGTTVIVRERQTKNDDGSIRTDRETRTIVEGTDTLVSESSTK